MSALDIVPHLPVMSIYDIVAGTLRTQHWGETPMFIRDQYLLEAGVFEMMHLLEYGHQK